MKTTLKEASENTQELKTNYLLINKDKLGEKQKFCQTKANELLAKMGS
jgi:hypothetical protein